MAGWTFREYGTTTWEFVLASLRPKFLMCSATMSEASLSRAAGLFRCFADWMFGCLGKLSNKIKPAYFWTWSKKGGGFSILLDITEEKRGGLNLFQKFWGSFQVVLRCFLGCFEAVLILFWPLLDNVDRGKEYLTSKGEGSGW